MSQVRSQFRPSRYNPMRSPFDGARRPGLPQTGLLGKWLAPGLVDTTGLSVRTIYPKQYLSGGSVTPPYGVTFVSNEGTGSISAGGVITGDVYGITDSEGNFYPFGTGDILWCTSGGNNLVMIGVTCAESLTFGSDWLNQYGYAIADGSQYADAATPIAEGVLIPAISATESPAYLYSYMVADGATITVEAA